MRVREVIRAGGAVDSDQVAARRAEDLFARPIDLRVGGAECESAGAAAPPRADKVPEASAGARGDEPTKRKPRLQGGALGY